MQKKLIALAVAAAAAAPAFAQSNVTVYGRLDTGFMNWGGSDTADNKNEMPSYFQAPSRLGFKGVEDLGNGLKAGFLFETRINPDRNEQASQTSSGSRRDAYLYLAGNFGTVALGRLTTPQDALMGVVDPFGSSVIAGYQNTWTQGAAGVGADVTRLDNTFAYISPDFSGLKVTVAYTLNGNGNENPGNESAAGDARLFAISPVYTNGPLMVGLNYHQATVKSTVAALDGTKEKVWDLGGTYDFGVAKLHAAYGQDKTDGFLGGDESKVKQWLVGLSAPVGQAGKAQLVYGQQKDSELDDSKTKRWAIGYTHSLSKRTALYAQYGDISYEDNSFDGFSNEYERAAGLGISHTF